MTMTISKSFVLFPCSSEPPKAKQLGHPNHDHSRTSKLLSLAMAAFNGGLRSGLKLVTIARSGSRGLHATGMKSMGGHGHDSEPFYIHAKHMYNLDRMKHQKLKMSLGVFTAFSIGVGVPIYAVVFQQHKTASG